MVSRWKKRFVVIIDSKLYYYKAKGSALKGTVDLTQSHIEMNSNDPMLFTIANKNTGEKLYFRAFTTQEKLRWMNALNQITNLPFLTQTASIKK